MEGQFLVRQIYDDEITYNLVGAAVEVLSKSIYKIIRPCLLYLKIENQLCLGRCYQIEFDTRLPFFLASLKLEQKFLLMLY